MSRRKTQSLGHKSLIQHEVHPAPWDVAGVAIGIEAKLGYLPMYALLPMQDTCAELQRRMAKLQKIAACNAKDAAFLSQVRP